MERYRVIGSVDNFDGQQDLDDWIQMVERAAEFAAWTPEQSFKAAMFRLRGEAGEFAEQLRDDGKLSNWKELKTALKERFNTVGKEQWHQFLLTTATQGSSTVREWAQIVRKHSLLALGKEGEKLKEEGERRNEEDQQVAQGGERAAGPQEAVEKAKSEARKKLLDYTRQTSFVRGLRSNLRQMVWRKKCTTFDEAVQAAAEEEAVESSHREEEVLSSYKKDIPKLTYPGLVDQIVAALEVREEGRQKGQEAKRREEEGSAKNDGGNRKTEAAGPNPFATSQGPVEGERREQDGYAGARPRDLGTQSYYRGTPAGRGQPRPSMRQYGEQLPLPRNAYAGQGQGPRQDWVRQGRIEDRGAYGNAVCYNCGGRGHFKRQCPTPVPPQQGNGYRRL